MDLSLRGRSCLWGPSRTILGTALLGVAGFGAMTQRVYAGRTPRNGESLYALRDAQVVRDSWRQGGAAARPMLWPSLLMAAHPEALY